MVDLQDVLERRVDRDSEQEMDQPATLSTLNMVRAAFYALPEDHPLRSGLDFELITMGQLSGEGSPIRLTDLLLIVTQLKTAFRPQGGVSSPFQLR